MKKKAKIFDLSTPVGQSLSTSSVPLSTVKHDIAAIGHFKRFKKSRILFQFGGRNFGKLTSIQFRNGAKIKKLRLQLV
jgi:hypothetical protein